MKRYVSIAFAALLLVSVAFAEIDLSSFTFDQLAALRDKIMMEMMARDDWQEVVVPAGTYQVGNQIPAGHWMIKPADGRYCILEVGDALEYNGKEIKFNSKGYYHVILVSETSRSYQDDQSFVDLTLTDGMYICIEKSSVVFTPYSGQPDFGFSFK